MASAPEGDTEGAAPRVGTPGARSDDPEENEGDQGSYGNGGDHGAASWSLLPSWSSDGLPNPARPPDARPRGEAHCGMRLEARAPHSKPPRAIISVAK